MATILFVHGTGVRHASFVATYALIADALVRYGIQHELAPCLWGDELGAAIPTLSIPGKPPAASGPAPWTTEQELARWDLLYKDPLFELRLLKQRPNDGPVAGGVSHPAFALWDRIQAYQPSPALLVLLKRWKIEVYWAAAREAIVVDDPTGDAIRATPDEIGESGQSVARAFVASMLQLAMENGIPLPDGRHRDELVDQLITDFGARVAGFGTFLLSFFGDVVETVATPIVKWKRQQLTMSAAPAGGDVLLYQARGDKIRAYIQKCIEDLNTEVIVLAHSLGGIACVDLLAMQKIPCVKKLITVASQAPLFQEIGALYSLEPKTNSLPAHFPDWLNIYDPNDFLSYLAAPVFSNSNVTDVRVESGQPFPQSHSAYWANSDTWQAIQTFVP